MIIIPLKPYSVWKCLTCDTKLTDILNRVGKRKYCGECVRKKKSERELARYYRNKNGKS